MAELILVASATALATCHRHRVRIVDGRSESLFIIVAIAVQNVPEGTSIAVEMDAAGGVAMLWLSLALGV